jgi:hypothetical protein
MRELKLTAVVRTPQSTGFEMGEGAGGVSMNSKESSERAFSCSAILDDKRKPNRDVSKRELQRQREV